MRIQAIILLFLSLFMCNIQAQDPNKDMETRMEELKAEKVAFFTQKMNLDSETGQKFWPLYNEFDEERRSNHQRFRELMQKMRQGKEENVEFTDAEYLQMADAILEVKTFQADLDKKYHEKFKAILTPKQLLMYYKADEQFGREMLRKFHKGQRGPGNGQNQ